MLDIVEIMLGMLEIIVFIVDSSGWHGVRYVGKVESMADDGEEQQQNNGYSGRILPPL